jgi:DNA-binding transcriptional LysR family regulator
MHIAGIDLNLAVVLHALLEERSVSRAARRIGLSQSATSHALARLRALLGDPLFVRSAAGLLATPRAEGMHETLAQALRAIESSFSAPPVFDPKLAQRTFHVGTSDYAEYIIMPALLTRLSRVAPGLEVWARPALEDVAALLAQGRLDLVIVPERTDERLQGLETLPLWEDDFVVAMRPGNPLSRGRLSLERFAAARHVLIAPRGQPRGVVDDMLEAHGLSRRVAFATPSFLVAPEIVARTDLVITLASRVALAFARTHRLTLRAPPLKLPGFRIAMFWHKRSDADPAQRFVRDEIARVAHALRAVPESLVRRQPRRPAPRARP